MYNLLSSDSMISLSRYSLLESCFVCRCLCANKWSSFYLFLVRVHPPSSLLRPSSLVWETVNLAAYGSTIGVSIAVCHCPLMCLYQICLRKYACVSVSRLHMRACLPIIFVKSVFISVWHDMTSSPSRTHHNRSTSICHVVACYDSVTHLVMAESVTQQLRYIAVKDSCLGWLPVTNDLFWDSIF